MRAVNYREHVKKWGAECTWIVSAWNLQSRADLRRKFMTSLFEVGASNDKYYFS